MLTQRNLHTLWLLLLLHVSGRAFKFNMFKRNPEPHEGGVRLSGSKSISEGRVEVYHDGKWGTVCDDGWDIAEAQVVCRQLHFPGAKEVVVGKDYGPATGPIWLDDITCKGTENHLLTCTFKGWGMTDCTHKEDVGVICETGSSNLTISDSSQWLDHSFSLSDELNNIFDSGNGCDFMILAKSDTGNKQDDGTPEVVETSVCAHKIILSRFPLFNASEGISSIMVDISEFCQPYFSSFIRYIYSRKIDVTFSSAECLHWMAYRFGVKQLMEDIGRLFSKFLPEDASFYTQVSLYQYAEKTGDLALQENCMQYLAWNFQNLTKSPAWANLPVKLLGVLLARSDLVVPDEFTLFQAVESWITEKGDSVTSQIQADLLSHIRFPMIPAEKLNDLESNSLYSSHKNFFQEKMLKAFQFNVLFFSNLSSNPKFNRDDKDYRLRIYTSQPWGFVITPLGMSNHYSHYGSPQSQSFSTPVHGSLIFKNNRINWEANVFRSQYECSNRGFRCESFPTVRLQSYNHQQINIVFRNRLLLMCQNRFICQVQDFKNSLAQIPLNSTQHLDYPCPDNKYTYIFAVRPEYV